MVCNPTVNYMLYEFLYARLSELRTRVARKVRLWISSPSAESWQNTLHVAEPGKEVVFLCIDVRTHTGWLSAW